jgi:hypothetical protein
MRFALRGSKEYEGTERPVNLHIADGRHKETFCRARTFEGGHFRVY